MKKLLLITISAIILNLALIPASYAQDPIIDENELRSERGESDLSEESEESPTRPPDNEALKEHTFDVREILTIPGSDEDPSGQDTSYLDKANPITSFIVGIIEFATQIIGSIAIILFIVAGFMFMFAAGNEQKVSDAKEVVKYAAIGLAVTFLSYILVIFVQSLFTTA